jgi:multidrug efflux pump subunit AcrB
MYKFWSFFIKNRQFSYIILIALILFGTISLIAIPKESNPEVQVPVAVVTTVFPGASAVDVEKLVTNKIEEQLGNNLENINKITSSSSDSVSSVVVEFNASADIDSSVQDTKDEVDKVKADLPGEAEDPSVSDVNFVDEPIMTVSLITDLPTPELIKLTDDLEAEIKKVNGVSRVETVGIPEREVQIVVNKEALLNFGINLVDVVQAISSSNSSLPAGSIEFGGVSYAVSFEGDIENPSEINDVAIINNNGQPVYVRDIAFVSDGVSDTTTFARVSLDGEPSEKSVSMSVFKKRGGDVTEVSDGVREQLQSLEEGLLLGIPYLVSFDTGEFVKDDLKRLSLTALQTVGLVMIILLLVIGWREALIAGLAIPLSFLIAFIGLNQSGNTINFISLFSLILAVGILVDSAIVVTEAIHTKMKEGGDKIESALKTIKEFHYPLTTGTATTIAVFAPLFIVSGVSGQFIASIPFTIIFVLIASLFVALALLPLIASILLKRRNRSKLEVKQEEITHKVQDKYRNFLNNFIGDRKKEKRFLIGMILSLIIVITFPFSGIVKVIFFDQEDIDFLFIEVERAEGTVLEQTDLSIREVEEVIYQIPEVESFITEVGQGSQFASGGSGEKLANITIILDKDRGRTSSKIQDDIRNNIADITSADVRVVQANSGPPTGAPVLIKFFGDDLDKIAEAVDISERVLNEVSGTTNVDTSTKNDATEFTLTIDRAKASQVGLDSRTVALTLRTALFGTDATTINTIDGDIDVVVKLNINENFRNPSETNLATIEDVENIQINTQNGTVLLGSLLVTDVDRANTVIRHEERKRVGSVSAELVDGQTAREAIREFNEKIENVELPEGVEISIGGETEESNTAFAEMGLSLIVGMVAVLSILVLQFNSYRQAIYIIAIVPLSLIGVFVGLAISGKALSFPSLMGFIALSGIVVNNSIILIDVMNKLRRDNPLKPIKEIVIEGAVLRLRPILLTTLTTVIGIIPLTYATDLWSPLAFSIMFGLSFAVIVTLILVPILYARWPGKLEDKIEESDSTKEKTSSMFNT